MLWNVFVWDAQKQPAGVGIATQDVTVTKSSKPEMRQRRTLSKGKILITSRYQKKNLWNGMLWTGTGGEENDRDAKRKNPRTFEF